MAEQEEVDYVGPDDHFTDEEKEFLAKFRAKAAAIEKDTVNAPKLNHAEVKRFLILTENTVVPEGMDSWTTYCMNGLNEGNDMVLAK